MVDQPRDRDGQVLRVGQQVLILDFRSCELVSRMLATNAMAMCIGQTATVEYVQHMAGVNILWPYPVWTVRLAPIYLPGEHAVRDCLWAATWLRATGGLKHLVRRYQREAVHG